MRSDAYQALLCLLFSPAYHIFGRDTMAAERKTFRKGKTEKFAAGHLPFSEKYGTVWSLEPQIGGQLTQCGGFGGSARGSEPHKRGQPNTGCGVMLRMRSGTVSSDDCARTGICRPAGRTPVPFAFVRVLDASPLLRVAQIKSNTCQLAVHTAKRALPRRGKARRDSRGLLEKNTVMVPSIDEGKHALVNRWWREKI